MAGEFGAFIAQKRIEKDVKLKPIAEKLGVSVTYLSDDKSCFFCENIPFIVKILVFGQIFEEADLAAHYFITANLFFNKRI